MTRHTNDDIAISVKDLTKMFKIPLESHSGLKQKLINQLKGRKGYREFKPLNDISFDIKKGEFFGIVGRNGSGKSTLLKTIAGIYAPERGAVKVNGTLVPFIELGVGFNAELSGRENVYLNGALLGFSHDEMDEMYDEIVDFAELHDFMEERLKNYSSGMQVRLAFSIAIRAKGDILLLDEVLAVGDEAFQRKCYDYFSMLKLEGKTVILVTHSMSAVNQFCTKAMMIKDGSIVAINSPSKIADLYSTENEKRYVESTEKQDRKRDKHQPFKITLNEKNIKEGTLLDIKLQWEQDNVRHAGIAIMASDGSYVFGPNTYQDQYKMIDSKKTVTLKVLMDVAPGNYFIKAALFGANDSLAIANINEGPSIKVLKRSNLGRYSGIAKLKHSWEQVNSP